jgi:hypothetical protein
MALQPQDVYRLWEDHAKLKGLLQWIGAGEVEGKMKNIARHLKDMEGKL